MKEKDLIKEPTASYSKHYTYRDYLDFNFDEMVEIIKGKIFKMSPAPSRIHQLISGNLFYNIKGELLGKKCQVYTAPFDVILPVHGKDILESDRVVQPDIVVVCDPEKLQENGCFGAPDWIIEILSPHTTKKDLQDKFDLYEESRVKEYWVVEPRNKTIEVFVLENHKYIRISTFVDDDEVASFTIPGLVVRLEEVFAE